MSCSECQCVSDMSPVSAVVNLDLLDLLLDVSAEDMKNLNYLDLENLKEQEVKKVIKNINENK